MRLVVPPFALRLRAQSGPPQCVVDPLVVLAHLELAGGRAVQVRGYISVHLQGTCRDHARDWTFHRRGHRRVGFVLSGCQQNDLASFEDRPHTHRDGVDGHVFGAIKEARVVFDRLLWQAS